MKTRGDFKRTAKPNMVMQHSQEFVLETHISNAKLTAGLWEREKLLLRTTGGGAGKSINVHFFWCSFAWKQNRMWGAGKLGLFQPEQGLKNLVLTYESFDAQTPNPGAFAACCASPWPWTAWAAEPGQRGWQAEIGLSAALTLCFRSSLN